MNSWLDDAEKLTEAELISRVAELIAEFGIESEILKEIEP